MEFVSESGLERIQIHAHAHMGKEVLKWDVKGKAKESTADNTTNHPRIERNRDTDISWQHIRRRSWFNRTVMRRSGSNGIIMRKHMSDGIVTRWLINRMDSMWIPA